jgi:hypothetical protein
MEIHHTAVGFVGKQRRCTVNYAIVTDNCAEGGHKLG